LSADDIRERVEGIARSRDYEEAVMTTFSTPSKEDAARWMRDVGLFETLAATELTPAGPPSPRRLRNLLEVAEFLVPFDDRDFVNMRGRVNFVDAQELARWTRATIGDEELADRIDEIVATGRAYTFLAPELKQVVLERVAQCWELVKPGSPE
jgi:hypothetical protein